MSSDSLLNSTIITQNEQNVQNLSSVFTSNADVEFEAFCKKYFGNSEPGFVKNTSNRSNSASINPQEKPIVRLVETTGSSDTSTVKNTQVNDVNDFYNADYINCTNVENIKKLEGSSSRKPTEQTIVFNSENSKILNIDFDKSNKLNAEKVSMTDSLKHNDWKSPYSNEKDIMNYWDGIYGYSKKNDTELTINNDNKQYLNYSYEDTLTKNKKPNEEESIFTVNSNFIGSKEAMIQPLSEVKNEIKNDKETEKVIQTTVVENASDKKDTLLFVSSNSPAEKEATTDETQRNTFKAEFRNKTQKVPLVTTLPVTIQDKIQANSNSQIKSSLKVNKYSHLPTRFFSTIQFF